MGTQRSFNEIEVLDDGTAWVGCAVPSWPDARTRIDVADIGIIRSGTTRWRAARSGKGRTPYVVRHENGVWQSLHRSILNLTDSYQIADHINGDTLDNRRSNLREASRLENARNQRGWVNRELPKGVVRHHRCFVASITVDRRRLHLGSYQTVEEAVAAYGAAAKVAFGDFARVDAIKSLGVSA